MLAYFWTDKKVKRRMPKKHKALAKCAVTHKETTLFNHTSSGIAGVLDNLRGKLAVLEAGECRLLYTGPLRPLPGPNHK